MPKVSDILHTMGKKICLLLCIFCGILSQEILSSSKENAQESSDLLVRKKRLINNSPYGSYAVPIEDVPYIVNILKLGVSCCAGSILSPILIITAAHCVPENDGTYRVLSGSAYRDRGISHNIIRLIQNPRFRIHKVSNDLAFLVIYPPIDLEHSPNRKITLYDGDIAQPTFGTVSGWGCTNRTPNGKVFPYELRSIHVPIILPADCQNIYGSFSLITNKEICTFDRSGKKRSCSGDSGGPLVVNGTLLGVMAWHKRTDFQHYPDVFMNMSYRHYQYWIASILAQARG